MAVRARSSFSVIILAMGKSKSGFTIVELLIVIVVIGILASITVVAFNGLSARATDSELKSKQTSIYKSLLNFYTLNSYYPCSNDLNATTLGIPQSTFVLGSTATPAFSYGTWPNPDGSGFGQSSGQCQSFWIVYVSRVSNQQVFLRNPGHRDN